MKKLINLITLLGTGCAAHAPAQPRHQPPHVYHVRTTAYTHTEAGGRKNAGGSRLARGSAAADWARWPRGTRFRIVHTGETFKIDDCGGALKGTSTIDLYKESRGLMNDWGARVVDIEVIEWGN